MTTSRESSQSQAPTRCVCAMVCAAARPPAPLGPRVGACVGASSHGPRPRQAGVRAAGVQRGAWPWGRSCVVKYTLCVQQRLYYSTLVY